MNRARPRRSQANADLAGKFGMRARHECRHLLVPHLDELEQILVACERTDDAVDTVAGVAEDPVHSPLRQPRNQKIADCICHRGSLARMLCSTMLHSSLRWRVRVYSHLRASRPP